MPPTSCRRTTITEPGLIICEGPSDDAFFDALITCRALPSFCIRHVEDAGLPGGNKKFGEFLAAVVTWKGFDRLKHIIIASDNDLDPAESFQNIRDQIATVQIDATPAVKYEVPDQPLVTAKSSSGPATTVLMLPRPNLAGNLESLCLEAAVQKAPRIAECVDKFAICTKASEWSATKQDKMKLQSMLACQSRRYPSIGLTYAWKREPDIIPLKHKCFDHVAEVLRQLGEEVSMTSSSAEE